MIFTGYTKTSHNYVVYNPVTRRFYERIDMIFDEYTPEIVKDSPSDDYDPEGLRTVWDWVEDSDDDYYIRPEVPAPYQEDSPPLPPPGQR